MFTKIHVENYRSLINLDFDLTYKQGKMKPLVWVNQTLQLCFILCVSR